MGDSVLLRASYAALSGDESGTYNFSDTFGASLGLEYLDVSDAGVSVELNQILLGLRWSF